jgi:hypothetical protein
MAAPTTVAYPAATVPERAGDPITATYAQLLTFLGNTTSQEPLLPDVVVPEHAPPARALVPSALTTAQMCVPLQVELIAGIA